MAFIIGTYNKFEQFDRKCARYVFEMNGTWYAIKEVELEWGIPKVPLHIDQREDSNRQYYVYDTYEDAMEFVVHMKTLNRR